MGWGVEEPQGPPEQDPALATLQYNSKLKTFTTTKLWGDRFELLQLKSRKNDNNQE